MKSVIIVCTLVLVLALPCVASADDTPSGEGELSYDLPDICYNKEEWKNHKGDVYGCCFRLKANVEHKCRVHDRRCISNFEAEFRDCID